ncbi:DinB family protein [Aquimarina sp. Aq78]|uniref:DinB family protein n=1 Tax=Aquimarina sp. Aq78 TaxID=1191889 RepID=UPI000D10E1DD|nr:DinB family protein [Aquimarina sp. Aq78]
MKKIIPFLILLVQCTSTSNNELTKEERNFAINELTNSKNNLLSIVDGMNEAQLNYKSDESSWSIAQCTEHITIFENQVFEILEESLELPANPERREGVKNTDKELMARILDRTDKAITQEDLEPNRTYGNHNSTIEEFIAKREKHINYINTTKDDLRNHFMAFGTVDAYQIFLYMSAHTERHIEQIKEIKENINFPKN